MGDKSGDGGGADCGGDLSRVAAPKVLMSADRKAFEVELRPGETTFVSWRKLVKDANRANGSSAAANAAASVLTAPAPEPPPNAHPNLQSRIVPGQAAEKDAKDEAPVPNRFSAVIEKIERLYMGRDSSDEEELDETPDDDQYDTEDSFIDDAELDEYFEVDNSAIKHDGFFVNRGKLERVHEPPPIPNQQPKKRRRNDASKPPCENDDGHVSNKHAKAARVTAGRSEPSLGKNNSNSSQNLTALSEQYGDVKSQNQISVSGIPSKKKSSEASVALDSSAYLKVPNGDTSVPLADVKDIEKSKMGFLQSKNVVSNKLKNATGSSDDLHQKYHDKNTTQSKSQHGKRIGNADELKQSFRPREKNGVCELPDANVSDAKHAMKIAKSSHMPKKDGSSLRAKSSMLEKAIRELEKLVAESRPPAVENQEADALSQGIKRRLPREIKLKLAKVARLAQASQGKVSKELLSRLMSILGHLIQLRTLKRNLKVMISMGVSAKQEKDTRFQQIKKEVIEIIKTRIPSEMKILPGASDDFQERGYKRKFSMDASLESKICELYDLFVDGLDEDAGPQIRKLYVELAQLWPHGMMDNHEIKRAICREKERRRAKYTRHKEQEKVKRKNVLAPGLEESVRVESASGAQPQHMRERSSSDSATHALPSTNKSTSSTTAAAVQNPGPSTSGSSFDRLKQEKLRGISNNAMDEIKVAHSSLPKKKVKRKPELELDGSHFRPEKLLCSRVTTGASP
ncbi:Wound-responsive family protein, putative isoform 2 [Hibiscus syriacus]|uniref:Wound-responsive family protein, putative isoform 2 n=1 Tax=Hibiscus syriacus TaxID=106335 RepID=A0A6A3CHZ3_HIBSY|nr:ubinuclein-1-like isoform X2 [Hibiscus syriacus]KAE8728347.1 Wound-responsive family protein, putative isoform 2 [Hibiscus syriacus]